jgi:hypothetical protein
MLDANELPRCSPRAPEVVFDRGYQKDVREQVGLSGLLCWVTGSLWILRSCPTVVLVNIIGMHILQQYLSQAEGDIKTIRFDGLVITMVTLH